MASAREWVAGTRVRTLPAAVVPVLIGSGVAFGYGKFSLWRAVLALLVALALQIGVNFANDYSDGVRGTDAAGRRAGPMRLVGSGAATPREVKYAAFLLLFRGLLPRAGARGLYLVVDRGRRGAVRARGVVLHRGVAAVRVPGARRGVGVRLLRRRRRRRDRVRADGAAVVAWAGGVGPRRAALLRAADDQQSPGHLLRRVVGQADAGRAGRRRAGARSCTWCSCSRRSRSPR